MNKNVIFALICIVIIVSSVSYIGCSASLKKQQKYEESYAKFEKQVNDTLSAYRDVEHIVVSDRYVGVYVTKETWNNSSMELQDQFKKEVFALVRTAAVKNEVLNKSITLAFFTSDRNDVGVYVIEE